MLVTGQAWLQWLEVLSCTALPILLGVRNPRDTTGDVHGRGRQWLREGPRPMLVGDIDMEVGPVVFILERRCLAGHSGAALSP